MELWTEYEGTTIDGAFSLTRLLQPEGRSALFSTSDGKGEAKILRLIESHFDDDEILARWRGVAALNHPHLLKLEDFGKVTLDETALVYAVLESSETNLGDVLKGQRLTVADTQQLAESMASALEALHSHGFVHEHVEPASILAVGEVVKLRSDCIREAPEGEQGRALKRNDFRDLSVVLLQALTQERTLEAAARSLPLPAPFDQIVRKGFAGELGAAEILAVLPASRPASKPAEASPAAKKKADPVATDSAELAKAVPVADAAAAKKPEIAETKPAGGAQIPIDFSGYKEKKPADPAAFPSTPSTPLTPSTLRRAAVAVVLLLCVWLGWRILHHPARKNAGKAPAIAAPAVVSRPVDASDSTEGRAVKLPATTVAKPSAVRRSAGSASPAAAATGDAARRWRVITYTYNREDQAQHKSETVAQKHPELNPAVFSPTGHAPYLVTVGGALSREEAFALVAKVRLEGLPRDSYAQNYKE